jgi:hypothetical protein
MIFKNNFDLNIVNRNSLAYLYLLGDGESLEFSWFKWIMHAECTLRKVSNLMSAWKILYYCLMMCQHLGTLFRYCQSRHPRRIHGRTGWDTKYVERYGTCCVLMESLWHRFVHACCLDSLRSTEECLHIPSKQRLAYLWQGRDGRVLSSDLTGRLVGARYTFFLHLYCSFQGDAKL